VTSERLGGTAYEVAGEGPTVVLVHGLGLNRHMWSGQRAALMPAYKVVSYDLLGHGESDKPDGPYPMTRFTDQLAALLDAVGDQRCALVGFSLGGLIVQAFALAHPERVSALAILNAAYDRTDDERVAIRARVEQAREGGPAVTVDAALKRWFTEDAAAHRPDLLESVRRWVTANDAQVYPHIYELLAEADADLVDAVAGIRAPTLVLTCAEDFGNSADMTERLAARIPGAQAVIVPGLRHMGLYEDPAAINAVLVPFLEAALQKD
jgi:pimeloyl-ACP methyl ester carboxylesterase